VLERRVPGPSARQLDAQIPRQRLTGSAPRRVCRGTLRAAPTHTVFFHSPFAVFFFHSLLAIRYSPFFSARRSLLATRRLFHSPFAIRHSPYLFIRHPPFFSARRSPLTARHLSPFAIRYSQFEPRDGCPRTRWVSTNARTALAPGVRERMCGCPQTEADPHPVSVGARHAVPLPFPYQQVGLCTREGRSSAAPPTIPAGYSRRVWNFLGPPRYVAAGRVWDPPLPGPAPFAIRRFFSFAIPLFLCPPLAARCSLLGIFPHSPFAARESPPLRPCRVQNAGGCGALFLRWIGVTRERFVPGFVAS
jgi:hypothetical protein